MDKLLHDLKLHRGLPVGRPVRHLAEAVGEKHDHEHGAPQPANGFRSSPTAALPTPPLP